MGDEELILGFVRGEADPDDLAALGITPAIGRDGSFHLSERSGLPVVEVTTADVAHGLVRHAARGTYVRDWAQMLLATGTVDFSAVEDDPAFQVLLAALWDAAGGVKPSDETLAIAESLAS